MDINELNFNCKKKIKSQIIIQSIKIEDKSFLHKGHKNNDESKFHLKLTLASSRII